MDLTKLPVEIIEIILNSPLLSVEDIINFSSTCTYFRNLVLNDSVIWKNKFADKYFRWRNVDHCYPRNFNFFEEIQYILGLQKRTIPLFKTLSSLCYKISELSDDHFEEWTQMLSEREQTFHYLCLHLIEIIGIDERINSVEQVPINTPGNKTLQYCACLVLQHIKLLKLTEYYNKYIHFPEWERSLEEMAIFVATWCQPHRDVSHKKIIKQLDSIANLVKLRLQITHPYHPLLVTSEDDLTQWRKEGLPMSKWTKGDCRELIKTIDSCIQFKITLNFKPEDLFIDKVLENRKGVKLIWLIIRESVGRRLGLHLEVFGIFPEYKMRCFVHGQENYKRGRLSSVTLIREISQSLKICWHPDNYLYKSVIELSKFTYRLDFHELSDLAHYYISKNIDTKPFQNFLKSQRFSIHDEAEIDLLIKDLQMIPKFLPPEVVPRQRSPELKFAVGMIMKYPRLRCRCVIIGWNINSLTFPSYEVILEDGSYRNEVAQEDLSPCTEVGSLLSVNSLGRHFSHFFENHFVPNAFKEAHYPEDKAVRHRYYCESKLKLYLP